LLSAGCASSANVVRPEGPPLGATIYDSNASSLFVEDPNGNRLALDQYNVSDVDHPGNVVFLIGLPFLAFGLGMLAVLKSGEDARRMDRGDGMIALGYMMAYISAIGGGGMVAGGGLSWLRSKRAAHEFEASRPPEWMIPPPAPYQPPWPMR
jgi:hypothetical protein